MMGQVIMRIPRGAGTRTQSSRHPGGCAVTPGEAGYPGPESGWRGWLCSPPARAHDSAGSEQSGSRGLHVTILVFLPVASNRNPLGRAKAKRDVARRMSPGDHVPLGLSQTVFSSFFRHLSAPRCAPKDGLSVFDVHVASMVVPVVSQFIVLLLASHRANWSVRIPVRAGRRS